MKHGERSQQKVSICQHFSREVRVNALRDRDRASSDHISERPKEEIREVGEKTAVFGLFRLQVVVLSTLLYSVSVEFHKGSNEFCSLHADGFGTTRRLGESCKCCAGCSKV